MIKERKQNIYKGTIKRAVIKTIIQMVVLELFLIIFCVGTCYLILEINENFIQFAILYFTFFVLWIGIQYLQINIKCEKAKVSRKIVETTIHVDSFVKVVPKQKHLKHITSSKKEISKKGGEYYAELSKYSEEVRILLKLDRYEQYLFFEYVCKEDFLESYEILQTK